LHKITDVAQFVPRHANLRIESKPSKQNGRKPGGRLIANGDNEGPAAGAKAAEIIAPIPVSRQLYQRRYQERYPHYPIQQNLPAAKQLNQVSARNAVEKKSNGGPEFDAIREYFSRTLKKNFSGPRMEH
jgi:hypothetical protein